MLLGIFKNNKNINKNPLNHIGNVINDLAYVFDKRLTKAIYNDLPESQKKNKTFLSHFFCNNLGYYSKSSSQCICNIGIFRNHCQTYGIEIWGKKGFTAFIVIIAIIFFILTVIMILKLIENLKSSNNPSIYSNICSLFSTPKHLVNLNLIIITLSKFLYMIIDPYCQKKYVSYSFDRVIDELRYSSIISIYFILFIIFVGLNANLNRRKDNVNQLRNALVYKIIKIAGIFLIYLIYPIQIPLSLLCSKNDIDLGGMAYLLYGSMIFAAILYCFTFWILIYLRDLIFKNYQLQKENSRKDKIKLTKIQKINIANSDYEERERLNNKESHREIIVTNTNSNILNFIKMAYKKNLSEYLDKAIDRNKNDNDDIDNYELMDFEQEMLILDLYNKKTDENNIQIFRKNDLKNSNSLNNINKKDTFDEDFSLNENDIKIINDIFSFSFLYMIVTIEFIVYNILSKFPSFLTNFQIMIVIYSICNLVDAQYVIIIYFVFFKNNIIQEYQNLKYIGELDKLRNEKGNDHKIYLNYENLRKSTIYKRYNDFINFYEDKKI